MVASLTYRRKRDIVEFKAPEIISKMRDCFGVVGFNWKILEEDSIDGPVIRVAGPITPIIKQQAFVKSFCVLVSGNMSFCSLTIG